jgi:hypothetical protein
MTRPAVLLLLGVLALPGCGGGGQTGQARADAATGAACRQRADQVYDQQNRAEIYSPGSQVNTPFSGNYTPGVSDRGLSEQFVHDRMVSDCVRNTGTDAAAPPPAAK